MMNPRRDEPIAILGGENKDGWVYHVYTQRRVCRDLDHGTARDLLVLTDVPVTLVETLLSRAQIGWVRYMKSGAIVDHFVVPDRKEVQ